MMTPKIFFSDIDGTLLNRERLPSDLLKREVRQLTAHGTPFVLISSRMPRAMTHIQEDLGIAGLPLICYNGGWVVANGETIHSCAIPFTTVAGIVELNRELHLHLSLYHADEWYAPEMDFWAKRELNNTRVEPAIKTNEAVLEDWKRSEKGAHKVMCMGEPEKIDKLVTELKARFPAALHLYRSKDTYLEIANREISKLTGIRSLLAHSYPDFTLADCVAYGDNYNDIEMLEAVGLGVAVGNARPEVKAVADLVVEINYEDGVARSLAQLSAP